MLDGSIPTLKSWLGQIVDCLEQRFTYRRAQKSMLMLFEDVLGYSGMKSLQVATSMLLCLKKCLFFSLEFPSTKGQESKE